MDKKTEALRLALEALTHLQPTALTSFYTIGDRDKAITAIREALAEQPATVTVKPNPPLYSGCYFEGVMAERERIVNLLMIQHEAAQERHNYWLAAAKLVQADVGSNK